MKKLLLILSALAFLPLAQAETSPEYIRQNSVAFAAGALPSALLEIFSQRRLVLLGENHGTKEMPELTGALVRALAEKQPLAFGLEFPMELQPQIDAFLANGDLKLLRSQPFFQDEKLHSGRGSQAMVELLQTLRTLKSVSVFCYDIPLNSFPESRDAEMAKNVFAYMEKHPNSLVVTYSGNLHSRLVSGLPTDPAYKLMGAEILRLANGALDFGNVSNLIFRVEEGSAWNCLLREDGKIDCAQHSFGPVGSVYGTAVPSDLYFLREPAMVDGHLNTIFVRKVSASWPI